MDEAELQATRQQIAAALKEIVAAEQQEKDTIEAKYAKQGAIGQWWEEEKAKARGMGKAVVGLLSFAKEVGDLTPLNQFMNAHKVAWDSWRNTDTRPYFQRFTDNLTYPQFKEVADVLGFDPRSITKEGMAEAWAMANFVWNDPETQKLLVQFGADYDQPSINWSYWNLAPVPQPKSLSTSSLPPPLRALAWPWLPEPSCIIWINSRNWDRCLKSWLNFGRRLFRGNRKLGRLGGRFRRSWISRELLRLNEKLRLLSLTQA